MALQLCIYLNSTLQKKLAARQGFDSKKPGEKEAHAKPIYRELDRAFEILQDQTRYLQKKFTLNEWKFLLLALHPQCELSKVADTIKDGILFSDVPDDEKYLLSTMEIDLMLAWVILDVVERFHAADNIEASMEGLKKLGVLCNDA